MRTILKYCNFCFSKAIILLIALVLALNAPINGASAAVWDYKDAAAIIYTIPRTGQNQFLITGDSFMNAGNLSDRTKIMTVILTAYSSTPDQTDNTPFLTAYNTSVRDGIVAANFLAFGTKVKIPSLFGDKVFTVEDRMAKKHSDKIDIWFPERHLAKKFGVQKADVIVSE